MKQYKVEVRVTPREGLLDPQGKAVEHALHQLDFSGAERVRVGKLVHFLLHADGDDDARARADDMCRKLLANPVTEDYTITLSVD
ncbi:MAG TPA: phosphoribosylformylglycinamidine synthase subunit PurS [Longimicrobiales bacterium]|nr:phosphoribosylformylglycinamidine synthase subunit PurS [Longimicrobiales bacterium]